jgi:type IV pilus assembly protein PilN
MYSLDVNFLNDRAERQTEAAVVSRGGGRDSPRPLYIGAAIGALLPGLVGGLWFFLQSQNASLLARQQELDSQLATLQQAMKEVENVNAQVSLLDSENQALARVFDKIVPWSAILQDFRGRVPAGVQVTGLTQTAGVAPPAAPTPAPATTPDQPAAVAAQPELPPAIIELTGYCQSFSDANDFVLVLQQSPFLDSRNVRLVDVTLIDNPTTIEFVGRGDRSLQVELPKIVQYKISAGLTKRPASELLQDMKNTLAVGLPARVDALRDLGVIKP